MKKFLSAILLISAPLFSININPVYMGFDDPLGAIKLESPIVYLTDDNFNEAIANGFSVVDFYADWCGPCQKLSPVFEDVAFDLQEVAAFYKANIDQNETSFDQWQVETIPTVVIFKDGKEVARRLGHCNARVLKKFILSNVKT